MASDELLSRMDRHLERGNELMARNAEAFDRNTEAFDRNAEAFDRVIVALDGQQEFMRELTLRTERSHAAMLDEMRNGFDTLFSEMRRGFADIHEGFTDQRRALLAILDRLPPRQG